MPEIASHRIPTQLATAPFHHLASLCRTGDLFDFAPPVGLAFLERREHHRLAADASKMIE
jgi:hypothetical protein